MEREEATERLYAREEAGRQALGLVGRAETTDFKEAFSNFIVIYKVLKKDFEEALSTSDVADPDSLKKEPNV